MSVVYLNNKHSPWSPSLPLLLDRFTFLSKPVYFSYVQCFTVHVDLTNQAHQFSKGNVTLHSQWLQSTCISSMVYFPDKQSPLSPTLPFLWERFTFSMRLVYLYIEYGLLPKQAKSLNPNSTFFMRTLYLCNETSLLVSRVWSTSQTSKVLYLQLYLFYENDLHFQWD